MEELRDWVLRARQGDLESYGRIVRRFQDMAYGYACSLLGDFHLAEDAAQEAFIEAYPVYNRVKRKGHGQILMGLAYVRQMSLTQWWRKQESNRPPPPL